MVRVLNFDTLSVDYVDIEVGGKLLWHLRDDVPTSILIRAFAVVDLERRYQEAAAANNADQLADVYAEYEQALCHHCAEIIRHSYPDVSDAEVAGALLPRAQMEILKVFFTLRLSPSGQLPIASPQPTPNRAARRRKQDAIR